ncbi:MAG: hypothetical protein ACRDI2_18375 [Chloroflexota bacterium]
MTTLRYRKLPHPLRDADLLYYDADQAHQTLEDVRRGAPLSRLALGQDTAPEEAEVRGFETRLRRGFRGRARAAWGWALWWGLLGPALSLLWVNFAVVVAALFAWLPPLAVLIATLGAVAGGPVLAVVVGLVPLIWAWRRAWRHVGEARRWGRLARVVGGRRFRSAPLRREADPGLATFATANAPLLAKLRAQAPNLTERGADGAAEVAQLAHEAYRLAVRHRLPGVAAAYHAIYARFDAAERQMARLEHAGGVLAERKVSGAAQRARREAATRLAVFAPAGRVSTRVLAPFAGLLAGIAALGASFLLAGYHFVQPGQAVIVDTPGARLARLGATFGLPTADGAAPDVVRMEGSHLGWPRPFAERHSVALGEQRVRLQAIFRQTGPDQYDVLLVELRFRISDLERWAQLDRDGDGVDALAAQLSAVLQNVLQQQRQEARAAIRQQNPGLADNPPQLAAQADQLVEARLEDIVRAFIGELSSAGAMSDAGVQISRQYQSTLVRGVPGALAGAASAE